MLERERGGLLHLDDAGGRVDVDPLGRAGARLPEEVDPQARGDDRDRHHGGATGRVLVLQREHATGVPNRAHLVVGVARPVHAMSTLREAPAYDLAMALREYIADEIALDCGEGLIGRREALRRLGLLGLAPAASLALLAACGSGDDDATEAPGTTTAPSAPAASTSTASTAATSAAPSTASSPGDASSTAVSAPLQGDEIRFSGPRGELIGVFAAAPDPAGAVLIIHENRGLTAHIRSLPARFASDGYSSLAIDLLSEEGGTAALPTEGDATAALGNAPVERLVADLRAGLDELERRAPGAGLACVGFCFGGGMTWQLLAAGEPRLGAAVPFYGPAPDQPDFSGSPNAAVLGVYAELDTRVNASQEVVRAALASAGVEHEIRVFPGVDHAFFNDTGPRYDAEQAALAYRATLDWFALHLST